MYKLLRNIGLFFFVFDISFTFLPLSTAKISTIIFLGVFFMKHGIKRNNKLVVSEFIFYFFILMVFMYNLFLLLTMPSADNTTFFRVIYFIIYSLVMSTIIPSFYKNRLEFFESIGTATAIQGVFVLISWVSSSYRQLLQSIVVNVGNISFLSERRPPGLMSSAGAGSSIILAMGTILLFYVIIKGNSERSILNIISFVLSFVATFIVGRTGLLLTIVLIVVILFESTIKTPSKSIRLIIQIPIAVFLFVIMINILSAYLPDQLGLKFDWVFSEFSNGILSSYTIDVLRSMPIKPISLDTVIGTSRIRLPGGNHDSGYIQNYHSMGLIASIIFYLCVLGYILIILYKNKDFNFKKENKLFLISLCLSMFIIEFKEPFIFYYFYPWAIFSILKLKESKNTGGNNDF